MNESDESFSHDDIAAIARQIWEEEGQPDDKAEEHWKRAIEHLRQKGAGEGAAAT
jgi:hypothetical protein